jgi:hypothetical protein
MRKQGDASPKPAQSWDQPAHQPETVMAILDRAAYLEGGIERSTVRRERRDQEMAEDNAFLDYTARVTKEKHAANVRELLAPYSNEAKSNYDHIMSMLHTTTEGGDGADGAPQLGPDRRGSEASRRRSLPRGSPRRVAAATKTAQGGEEFGFEVDTHYATQFNRGVPMPELPAEAKKATDVSFAFGDDDDDDPDMDGGARADDEDTLWKSKSVAAIGRRKVNEDGPRGARNREFRRHLQAVLAPPAETATYAHELAHLFNMLDSNNIVLVATEEQPHPVDSDKPEYRNSLVVLSPTNGLRLRQHLDTPPDQPRLLYTSHGWVVRQSLLSAILQGRVDFEHLARVHKQLETTFFDLKRSEALLRKKDSEIAREKTRNEHLTRATETLIARSRLRRAFLVQLAYSLKSAHTQAEERALAQSHLGVSKARGSYLADYILRTDNAADADESAVVGAPGSGGSRSAAGFSTFEELQASIAAYEDQRSAEQQRTGSFVMTTNHDLDGGFGQITAAFDAGLSLMTPAVANGRSGSLFAGTPGGLPALSINMPSHQPYTASAAPPAMGIAGLVGAQAHDSLLRRLQQKVDRAVRRRNFERRMELMERAALEGEEYASAVNTMFRFGEHGYARLRDILAGVSPEMLKGILRNGTLQHAPLAPEGTIVICPCCKFEFDPSKPAAFYKDAILARQRKAREIVATKAQADAAAAATEKQKGKGGKSVNAGNMAGRDDGKGGKGRGRGDGDDFAVMALQETVDELTKHTKELERRTSELEAEVEMASLSAATAQQRAQTIAEEFSRANQELRSKTENAIHELDVKSRAVAAAEAEVKSLKAKLQKLEKASEVAFEELEQRQTMDRKVGELQRLELIGMAVQNGELAWENVAKTYYRRFLELTNQLRRLGVDPIETLDKYVGSSAPLSVLASFATQFNLVDTGIDPRDLFAHREIQAVPWREDRVTQTPLLPKHADATTNTGGVQVINHTLLKSEVKAGQQAGWINENGEEVTAVMMRKDVYAHLLRASDHSEQMREYIHILERKDKDEQERHSKEINDLTKEKQREIQALQTEVASKAATIEQLRARLAERSELLHQTTKLADQLKGEIVKQRKSYEAKLAEAQNEVKTVEVEKARSPLRSPPSTLGGSLVRTLSGGIDVGIDADAFNPYEQLYRPAGQGRAVVQRVHARTTAEVEEEEAEMRRRLEGQYAAFTIPLPLLLALLTGVKAEVREAIEIAERRGRQREARLREVMNVTKLLLGQELGVTDVAPAYLDDGTSRPDDENARQLRRAALGYRVLQGREFSLPLSSGRDPVTGAWIREPRHGTGVVPAALRDTTQNGAAAMMLRSAPSFSSFELRSDAIPEQAEHASPKNRRTGGAIDASGRTSIASKHGHVMLTATPEQLLASILRKLSEALGPSDAAADASNLSLLSNAADAAMQGEGEASAESLLSPGRKFASQRRVHQLSVDGRELPLDQQAHAFDTSAVLPFHIETAAAHRARQLDAIRQQRGPDVFSPTATAAMPQMHPDMLLHSQPAWSAAGPTGAPSAAAAGAAPSTPTVTPRPRQLPAMAHSADQPLELLLRGRANQAGANPDPTSRAAWVAEETDAVNNDAARRVELLTKRNATETRRIRGIRAGAASAPLVAVDSPMEPIIGRPPIVHGPGPTHAVLARREPRLEPGAAPRPDIIDTAADFHSPAVRHGITGAVRGSIAVKRPVGKPSSLTQL